jgi:hypothetical protein
MKYLPSAVSFLVELTSNNMNLLLRLSNSLRVEFDYKENIALENNITSKVKVLINLYESEVSEE